MGLAAMFTWDALGYLASGLVFAAFCMKDIIPLRAVAVGSNLAFLSYGLALGLVPVWLLHAVLLPINCWRLWQGVVSNLPEPSVRLAPPSLQSR
jgi:CRP/FNR family transcriptional regulator, cyclic AMP receptor protein